MRKGVSLVTVRTDNLFEEGNSDLRSLRELRLQREGHRAYEEKK